MAEKPEIGLLIGVGKPKPADDEESEPMEDGKLLAVQALRKAWTGGSDQDVLDALVNVFDQLDQEEDDAEGEMPEGDDMGKMGGYGG